MQTLTKTNTPGIFRTETGTYRVIVTLPGGKQRKATAANMTEAKRVQAALRNDVANQVEITGTHTIASYYRDEWLPYIQRHKRKPTVSTYVSKMERWIIPAIGTKRLTDLRTPDITRLQDKLMQEPTLSRQTVVNILVPLKSLLSHARERGACTTNVALRVKAPEQGHDREAGKVKTLTEAQLSKFMATVDPEHATFFLFLAQTGCRVSEALAVRWCDLTHDRIHVTRRYAYGEMMPPKSGKSRHVPISSALYTALTIHHKESRWQGADDLIFPGKWTGRPQHTTGLRSKVLTPALKRAGIKAFDHEAKDGISFHVFRHGFALRLRDAGVPLLTISRLLGHASLAITEKVYLGHFDMSADVDMSAIFATPTPTREKVPA